MTGVHLQYRLGPFRRATGRSQHLFQLQVQGVLDRNNADGAARQAIRNPDIGHLVRQRLLGKCNEAAGLFIRRCRTAVPVSQRYETQICRALRDGLERLALVIDAHGRPEAVDLIGEQQDLDATGLEPLDLRGLRDPIEIIAGGVVDRCLVFLQGAHIVLQRTPHAIGCRALEPGEAQQLVTPFIILVEPFLYHRPEILPDGGIAFRVICGELAQFGEDAVADSLLNGRQNRAVLDHLARHVERKVGGIHKAAHETQIARQNLCLVRDEHTAHIELDATLAVRVEQIEGLGFGDEGQDGIFVTSLCPVVQCQRRLIELSRHAAVEVGIVVLADVGPRLGP